MKKWMSLLLAFYCLLGLVGCSESMTPNKATVEKETRPSNPSSTGTSDPAEERITVYLCSKLQKDESYYVTYKYNDDGLRVEMIEYTNYLEPLRTSITYGDHKLEMVAYFGEDELFFEGIATFNKEGKEINSLTIFGGSSSGRYYEYVYSGNTVFYYVYDYDNGSKTPHYMEVETYDEHGNLTTLQFFYDEGFENHENVEPRYTEHYVYNEAGQLIEKIRDNGYGSIINTKYTYNEYGNVTKETEKFFLYDELTRENQHRYSYTYDTHGNIVEEKYYLDGNLQYTKTYSYITMALTQEQIDIINMYN